MESKRYQHTYCPDSITKMFAVVNLRKRRAGKGTSLPKDRRTKEVVRKVRQYVRFDVNLIYASTSIFLIFGMSIIIIIVHYSII